jgi:hypothetical protein
MVAGCKWESSNFYLQMHIRTRYNERYNFQEEGIMRKRWLLVPASFALVLMLSSCMSMLGLWPDVEPPMNASSSMLVVEAGEGAPGDSESLFNSNFTGWAPWVEDEHGNLIAFKPFDIESRLDSFFYAENLSPGKYTLKGFIHVYTDYSKLSDGELASYGPFAEYPYHERQFFQIDEPIVLDLEAAAIDSFGRYYITYDWKDGASGNTDDRWKVTESSVSIGYDAADRKALRVAKNWATPNWKLWNERNPEEAADE